MKALLTLLILSFTTLAVIAEETAFTFTGTVPKGSGVTTGRRDFQFTLYTAASNGLPLAGPITNRGVDVVRGVFTTSLDW